MSTPRAFTALRPPDAVAPQSMLVWRRPFGLHSDARLPAPPTSSNVSHLTSLAEELCGRIPAPLMSPVSPTFFDSAIAWIRQR